MNTFQMKLGAGLLCLLASCSAAVPGTANDGPPTAEGCRDGTHFENNECTLDSLVEDCAGSVDSDGDGKVPALDSDCIDAGPGGTDGGQPDGAVSPGGSSGFPCTQFCFLLSPVEYQLVDGGRVYFFPGDGPVPTGPGITQTEVGFPDTFALKVCYAPSSDADGDSVTNCEDNCWRHHNPEPTNCQSNDGCVNAGGICLASGKCSAQLDTDHDGVGDVCDPREGESDSSVRRYPDPDSDSDGIQVYDDRCPSLATTPEENAADADKDGTPNVCDPCAYPNMSCQH